MFRCPNCAKWIQVDDTGRVPPWCKACGASLKNATKPLPPNDPYTPVQTQRPETNIQRHGAFAPMAPAPSSTDIQAAETRRPAVAAASTAIQEGLPSALPARPPVADMPVEVPDISISANQLYWNSQPMSVSNSRAGRYRVYLTRTELFFILMEPDKGSTRAAEAAGFVIGGIVGGLLTRMALEEPAPLRTTGIADVLRGADEETLRLYAQREPGCFYRVLELCDHIRIDKPSTWASWIHGIEHEATLIVTHNGVEESWALSNYHDVRKAAQGLFDALGGRLEMGIDWGLARR